MRMAQFEFLDWLEEFLTTDNFIFEWDEGNETKNEEKHGATSGKVILFISFTLRNTSIRVISARKANRKEVGFYEKEIS
jgi:uncharacterized DUF497 family protein